MSPRKNSLFLCILFLIVPPVSAWTSQEVIFKSARPLKQAVEAGKEVPKSEDEDGTKPGGTFLYDPVGKTDPFKSFIAEVEKVEEPEKRKPRTYLETVDLSQLELIAIIVGPMGNWAMVRDSKGTGHVIQQGTYVGTRGGVVHEIKDDAVVVREAYKDFRGNTQFRNTLKKVPSLQ